jgi:hypothetical protein
MDSLTTTLIKRGFEAHSNYGDKKGFKIELEPVFIVVLAVTACVFLWFMLMVRGQGYRYNRR